MKSEIELAEKLGIEIIYQDISRGPKMKITIEFEGE